MLTKEERAAIAKRASSYNDGTFYFADIYKCLFGEEVPDITSEDEDTTRVIGCLVDLCDTSNMIELPVDKDGEVIRIGDTVYDSVGDEYKVTGYKTLFEDTNITLSNGSEVAYREMYPHKLTHKKPVTIASINEQIKHLLDKGHMSAWSMAKLFDIADQLESLGDNDE